MLGRHSPQGEMFRPDFLHLDHVGRDSLFGFMATERHRIFRDRDFEDLYRKGRGRPSVPPSQLCIALLLQAKEGVSDDEAVQRTAYDLRWKVALGLDIEQQLCAKSTLQLFRSKLILHEKYQQIFETSVEACRRGGLLKRKKLDLAIDTTPVFGRGAVKDTFNLISDQIRHVVDAVVILKDVDREALVAEQGLGRHFGPSFKGLFDIDWDDADQKRAVVAQLVGDAKIALSLAKQACRGYAKGAEATSDIRSAMELLQELLLQDIDESPEDSGPPTIRKGTKPDRIVSTTDPEMRHGRKSSSKTFNGYKASVAADARNGVILATDVIAGNAPDATGSAELCRAAADAGKKPIDSVLGDTAYGASQNREEISSATGGAKVVAKVQPVSKRKGTEFTVEDFEIDIANRKATCPAGKTSIRHDQDERTGVHRFVFSVRDCSTCSLLDRCTKSKAKRRQISVAERYDDLKQLRAEQRTLEFKKAYRRRVTVEHRIARLVQLGIRQAKYLGRAKVAFQVAMAATVANFHAAVAVT